MNRTNTNYVSLTKARERLFKLWGRGLIIICIIGIFMTFGRIEYSGIQSEIWGWITPLIIPNFSLMLSIYAADAILKEAHEKSYKVKKKFYHLSSKFSYIYLFLILLSLIIELFFSANFSPLEVLRLSAIYLSLFQGIVTTFIGVLFFKKIEDSSSQNPQNQDRSTNNSNNTLKKIQEFFTQFFK